MINIKIPEAISIGPIQLHFYGILLGIGFAIIYVVLDKRYKDHLKWYDYLIVLTTTITGARALFILNNFEEFIADPLFYFQFKYGGFALFGALTGLIVGVFIVTKMRKIQFLEASDLIFTYLPIVQAIGRFGNYINQELYGKPTDLPWGIFIDEENRLKGYEQFESFHPTFLYEAILNLINFYLLKKVLPESPVGIKTSFFFINYSIIRLFMNRIRIDKEFFGPIENSDLFSLLFLIAGVVSLMILYRRKDLKKNH